MKKVVLVLIYVLFSIFASAQELNPYKPYVNFGYGIGYTYGAQDWKSNPSHAINILCYGSYNWFLLGADCSIFLQEPNTGYYNLSGYVIIGARLYCNKNFAFGLGPMIGGVSIYDYISYTGYNDYFYPDNNGRYYHRGYYVDHWKYTSKFDFGVILMQEFYIRNNVGIVLTESTSIYNPITLTIGLCIQSRI